LRLGLLVVAVVAVAGGFVCWQVRSTSRQQLLGGASVNGRPPAPDFALTDQFGRVQQLSQLRGKPVALTFLYTTCPMFVR
jgi:protein SCO1/2